MSRNYVHLGPLDSSLLTFQVHHRSESVWANQEYKAQLSCVHYACGAFRNMRMNDRVEELLRQSGFITITCLRHMKLDHHLITALVERWRPEVHTFHMPFGEVTISLQDVEVLLGLKIDVDNIVGVLECFVTCIDHFVERHVLTNLLWGGCLILLQLWAWERLPFTRPGGILPVLQNDAPYAARWQCPHSWTTTSNHTFTTYRDELDRCQVENFIWMPYNIDALPICCRGGQAIWTARVPLLFFFYAVEWHYPDRVEALRHISIQGAIAAEQGQSNNYTNVMQQIGNDELNRLNYGYVLQFPRTAGAYFYEPIDQVLGPDQRR
nr:serine/threonine-protein phosphatase 7 long form homolog [Ipomoea batatas]